MNQNLVGRVYGRSSLYEYYSFRLDPLTNMATIDNSCFWSVEIKKIFYSETRRHNELLLCRNDVWEILCKISIFRANCKTNMATIGSYCFWLDNLKKKSSLKPFGQLNWHLVGSTYGRFCIKFPQSKITGEWLSPMIMSLYVFLNLA